MQLAARLSFPFQTIISLGPVDLSLQIIREKYQKDGWNFVANGDALFFDQEQLTIDDVRAIRAWTTTQPEHHDHKLLVLAPQIFLLAAQQALLKTLEEPSGSTRIIICIQKESDVLPTILSRGQKVFVSEQKKEDLAEYISFLAEPIAARLKNALVIPFFSKKQNEKPSKEQIYSFFEKITHATLGAEWGTVVSKKQAIEVLQTVVPYIQTPGASVKQMVEFLCLCMPKLRK